MRYYLLMMTGIVLFVLPLSTMFFPYLSILGFIISVYGAIMCDRNDERINKSINEFFGGLFK